MAKVKVDRSFTTIFEKYNKIMFTFIFSKVKNSDAAEEITQEMWLRVLKTLKEHESEILNLAGWLYGIARNCCHEWWRKQKREAQQTTLQTTPDSQKQNITSQVLDAIYDLPDEQRTILLMKYVEQMSCSEISKALDKPEGTVRSILSRSYDTLREIVQTKLVGEVEL